MNSKKQSTVALSSTEAEYIISENNTWRQVRPERLAHLAHKTSIANQDATTNSR